MHEKAERALTGDRYTLAHLMDSYLLGTLIRISCEINRMIQTVCRICAEPQQILPTAENEGKFKIIFKEEVSYHLLPPVPTCSIVDTISRLREVETDEPLSRRKSVQCPGTRSAPTGVREYSVEGEGWARGVLRPLQASPCPEHPRRSPHSSPNQGANSCWAVTSQFAVFKKGTRGAAGGETLPVCSHHQSRSHFLPFIAGPKGQRVKQTAVPRNPPLGLLSSFGKQADATLVEGEKFLL